MQRVIVFGTGKFYQDREYKIKQEYEIVAFLDNKIVAGRKIYYQDTLVPIYNPMDANTLEDCPILIMTRQFIEVCEQLLQIGIAEERILFGISLYPRSASEQITFSDGEGLKIRDGEVYLQLKNSGKHVIRSGKEYERIVAECAREKEKERNPMIGMISNMPLVPASRLFGSERGKPIDRYYIEKFLEEHKEYNKGDILEIADATYSMTYGEDRIRQTYILHVEGWGENTIKGNLETGEGIEGERFDTAIITQTLMFIYDIQSAAQNIYRMLKPSGTALVTVAGISQISRYDADNWGSYYSFHVDLVKKLFEPLFGKDHVEIISYGNVKTAVSLLYGLCCEDLAESDFEMNDLDYPLIIGAVLHR